MMQKQKAWVRFIGDIHGEERSYRKAIKDAEHTFQIGDMGFRYDWMEDIDPVRHRFISGNHDNTVLLPKAAHYLGRFGVHEFPDFPKIFYVGGGFSVDHFLRKPYISWWPDEQLSYKESLDALELYKEVRPDFVVSHECPLSIVSKVSDPNFLIQLGYTEAVLETYTNRLLETMREFHKPKVHIFGHFHRTFDRVVDGTRFICINIGRWVDFPKEVAEIKDAVAK